MFIFLPPVGLATTENDVEIIVYYSVFWILYNMGLATVQVCHLAMIPELSDIDETRTSLTLIRNTMTAFANILAYIAALVVFSSGKLKYD